MFRRADPAFTSKYADLAIINQALKLLCREHGIDRDRRLVLQVSTLLMGLWREGVREPSDLVDLARVNLTDMASECLAGSETR